MALAAQEGEGEQFEAAHEGARQPSKRAICRFSAGLQGQLQNEQDSLNTAKQQRVFIVTGRNLSSTGICTATSKSAGWSADGPCVD